MNLNLDELRKLSSIVKNRGAQIQDSHTNWQRNTNSDILLVDGTNTFIRCWSANPSLDENGNHTGGIVGFLKSVGYAIKTLAPTRCIIIFDGIGGSFKRRKIYPEYKENRKGKVRLNRVSEDMSGMTDEEKSKQLQFGKLVNQYLNVLPITKMWIDYVEADDVIALLATEKFKDSRKVMIMSSDKDFLQLCKNNVSVYSPTKKRIYGPNEVLAEYQIHPNNFVLYRAMDGDDSDNVNGIEGAGPKTIIKHFPWLNEEKEHTIDELILHASDKRNKYKVCENIATGKELLERNVALMQLKDTALTAAAQLECYECVETKHIPRLDRNAFYRLVREDMLENNLFDHVNWVNDVFGPLDTVTRTD